MLTTPPAPPQLDPNDPWLVLLRSRTPLMSVETQEEHAVLARLHLILTELMRPLYSWSITRGLQRLDLMHEPALQMGSNEVLDWIAQQSTRSIFVLFEFEPFLGYAMNQRKLREIALRHNCADHTLVLVSPKMELPASIDALTTRAPIPLPSAAELTDMLKLEASNFAREQGGKRVQLFSSSVITIVRLLAGLPMADARRIAQRIIARDGKVSDEDIPDVIQAKFQLLEKSGVLHFEPDTVSLDEIAGLDNLKEWVKLRRGVFTGTVQTELDPPRGVLLLGVQGCGKSMAAKAIAQGFGAPLLRLDMGAVYDKFQGESERKLRESLEHAARMAPCVLWLDEIEKGMATSSSDDGVSRRVLGAFLTWLSERKTSVFVVATANQIEQLPPELLRKGRFDEIFFVDLPRSKAREQAFVIHLRRRKADPGHFDTLHLAQASNGFSGAEIEQAIIAAQYRALAAKEILADAHLLAELAHTKPLSVVMAESVAQLRDWAKSRTVPADR
jgi:AAA+ superfamily predicted ATPase